MTPIFIILDKTTDVTDWQVAMAEFSRQRNAMLRDYFAAAALTGLVSCDVMHDGEHDTYLYAKPDWYAAQAYALADAMLAARGGK